MGDKFPSMSPYNYANNNPIRNIDPNGMEFTEAAQKWVDRYLKEVNSRIESNNAEILRTQSKISEGGLSDKQLKRANNRVERLQGENKSYENIRGEAATLAASSQIYDVKTSSEFSDSQTTRAGAGFDFSTGNFVITMPNSSMELFSHELKHAFQFENGSYSIGPALSGVAYKNLLYDKHDEIEGYNRQSMFGGPKYGIDNLPADYQNIATGPYDFNSISAMNAVIGSVNQSQHLQNLANRTGHAFRINGQTYFRKR